MLAAAGLAGVPGIDVPPFLSELHGSFGDLVQQLQECVQRRRQGEGWCAEVLLVWCACKGGFHKPYVSAILRTLL